MQLEKYAKESPSQSQVHINCNAFVHAWDVPVVLHSHITDMSKYSNCQNIEKLAVTIVTVWLL